MTEFHTEEGDEEEEGEGDVLVTLRTTPARVVSGFPSLHSVDCALADLDHEERDQTVSFSEYGGDVLSKRTAHLSQKRIILRAWDFPNSLKQITTLRMWRITTHDVYSALKRSMYHFISQTLFGMTTPAMPPPPSRWRLPPGKTTGSSARRGAPSGSRASTAAAGCPFSPSRWPC